MQKCKIKENTNNYNSSANIIYDTGTKYHKSDIYKYLSLDEKRLFENNKIKCSNFYINDVLGRGLSGDIEGKKARIKNVVLSNYEFENVIVSYPDSVFFKKISIYRDNYKFK